jgi:hypothetical protein
VRREKILAAKLNFAFVRLDESQQHPRERRLAASRFADDAERLAALELEADIIDSHAATAGSAERTGCGGIRFAQISRYENWLRTH